jgi:glutathione S-transferase
VTTSEIPPNDDPIFHLAMPTAWAEAFVSGEYLVSTRDASLDEVGFIHCSVRNQIESTANSFYDDVDQLVILTIDPLLVPSQIVFEPPAPESPLLFPHIYGPLPVSAVNLASPWTRGSSGWSLSTL